MKAFDALLEITEALHGPKGCPWDKEQTFQSLRPYILEEAHELLEAVDADDTKMMVEELGDVLFQVVFLGKLGQKTGRFTLEDVCKNVSEKLVRRHPHVFGEVEAHSSKEVLKHWERIKGEEKKERKHPLEGIPKTLGALARTQKIIEKMSREEKSFPLKEKKESIEEARRGVITTYRESSKGRCGCGERFKACIKKFRGLVLKVELNSTGNSMIEDMAPLIESIS